MAVVVVAAAVADLEEEFPVGVADMEGEFPAGVADMEGDLPAEVESVVPPESAVVLALGQASALVVRPESAVVLVLEPASASVDRPESVAVLELERASASVVQPELVEALELEPVIGGPGAGYAAPNRGQLNSFLGLPSDGGLQGVASNPRASQRPAGAGGNFDVNRGSTETPGGGKVGGISVTGPGGATVGRAVGVGAGGGVASVGGVQGAGGGTAARGVAAGPGGVAAVGGVRGPGGGAAARGVAAGPGGVAAGFARVTPAGRYRAGVAVRSNFRHYGVYGRGWYAQYPGAWLATGLAAGAVWNACTWDSATTYCGYSEEPPIYYDYGDNVVYEDNSVYVDGDNAGTAQEYYDQAANLAAAGAAAECSGRWRLVAAWRLRLDQS